MRILVLDRFNHRRDMAQMDIYSVLAKKHHVTYSDDRDIMRHVMRGNYDLLYLGIYHQTMNVNWDHLFKKNTKPVIIDQADNEEFLITKIDYSTIRNKKLLSRYLPNKELQDFWKENVYLFPWYINPERFRPGKKIYNFSFISSTDVVRIGLGRNKIANDLMPFCTGIIGECFDELYASALANSKMFIIECGRLCLTQKYIEAALSECVIIGHVPVYPTNDLIVIPFDFNNITKSFIDDLDAKDFNHITDQNKQYVLDTFCNRDKLLNRFEGLLV